MSEGDAVFETSDHVLYLSSANFGRGEFERRLVGEGGMRRREPGTHLFQIAFEQLECESHEAGETDESIGLLRLESFGVFPPGHGSCGDLKDLRGAGGREIKNATKSLERLVG
jgi:hypothetical protein